MVKKNTGVEKLGLKTKDLNKENIEKLSKLFPEILTEVEKDGNKIKTINVDKLKELVGDFSTDEDEVYQLNWVGKRDSKKRVSEPITKTLKPLIKYSVDFEKTKNLYIEGDNFEVLKLLKESYLNSVKMIYIDPPYNTGKDFVYKDDFSMSKEEYDEETKAVDDEGNKLFKNTTTNGRFHSDWLSMMYERLKIAYDLLKDEGIIFISIGNEESHNLRHVMNQLFGENNFLGEITRKQSSGSKNDTGSNKIITNVDKILVYSKSDFQFYPILQKNEKNFSMSDENGEHSLRALEMQGGDDTLDLRPKMGYSIYFNENKKDIIIKFDYSLKDKQVYQEVDKELTEKGYNCYRPRKRGNKFGIWRWGSDNLVKEFNQNNVLFKDGRVFQKERKKDYIEKYPDSLILEFINTQGTIELKELFENCDFFSFPKPVGLIRRLILHTCQKSNSDIILDFFSGSATTAHAVMQLNAEDGGNRKFIMVQLPEETDKESEAYKAGYKNICEIGKERIRRAAKKIKEDNKGMDLSKVDFGFKVFRLDSSNMKDVYYNPNEIDQRTLTNFKDNIKDDRTSDDLLYQVLLDLAIPISSNVRTEKIKNKKVYVVETDSGENWLIACFDEGVNQDLIKDIAELKPLRIVFRDSSFKNDTDKVNCEEYLKHKLPNTQMRVI